MSAPVESLDPQPSSSMVYCGGMNLITIALLASLYAPAQVQNLDSPKSTTGYTSQHWNYVSTRKVILLDTPDQQVYWDNGTHHTPNCNPEPRSIATNFSADIKGDPDNRPDTWGDAGYIVKKITFTPKPGCRIRITKAYGDFLIWPVGKVERGKFAGALFGLRTTAPEGSIQADWAADNTFLYIQVATGGEPARAAFNYDVASGGLLGSDNVMLVKMAVWLNDTGLPIHMEPSFVIQFQYEDEK